MTDHQFLIELRIRAYMDQIRGYPLGHPARETFHPIIVTFPDGDGKVDRQKTLDSAYTGFNRDERALLLEESSG